MRPDYSRRACGLLLAAACMLTASAGCGSDSEPRSGAPPADAGSRPGVADRVYAGDRLFGLPAFARPTVRTDSAELNADLPGFYADPEQVAAELRRDGFVAGVGKTFKTQGDPDGAMHVVVQMRDAQGALAEFERQIDSLLQQPCPPGVECERDTQRFTVPGLPGAAGVNTTLTIEIEPDSPHPDVLRADAIVFRDGAFVEQLFLGTERPAKHRAELIETARELFGQGS